MYNSQNLPLSPKKFIKKTIARTYQGLVVIAVLFIGYIIVTILISPEKVKFEEVAGVLVVIALVTGLWLVYFFGVLIYEYLYYKLYFYNFTDEQAEIRKGVISRRTGFVRYERIQNVYVDQDFWDRIFGLYDVHYETAGETSGFYSHVDGLSKENAEKLVQFLNEKTKEFGKKIGFPESKLEVESRESQKGELPEESNEIIDRNKCPISKLVVINRVLGDIILIFCISIFALPLIGIELYKLASYLGSYSMFLMLGKVLLFFFCCVLIFDLIYQYIWYKNFYFVFKKREAMIRTKVISQSISYLYYDRIQNINLTQSLLDRIFQLYQVQIETAAEATSRRLIIAGLKKEDAEKLRDFLLEKAKIYRAKI